MKKKKKLTKVDKQGLVVIAVVMVIIGLLVIMTVNSAKCKATIYEYAVDGKIYKSKKCYERENGEAICFKDNELVKVDNYYEVE